MPRNLSARALIVNQLPHADGRDNALSELINATMGAGWGLLALGAYKPGRTVSDRTIHTYGPDRGNFSSDRFGALIISAANFSDSRSEWPGIELFPAYVQDVLPVALVHSEPLPEGVELAANDIAIATEPLSALRTTISEWLGQSMMLLQARF